MPESSRGEFLERLAQLLPDSERQIFLVSLDRLSEEPRRALRLSRLVPSVRALLAEVLGRSDFAPVPWEPEAVFVEATDFLRLSRHPLVGSGAVYMQEPGAMEAVALLDPKPGEKVLDLCAAPGSKSGQIGERLGGQGWLVSSDPDRSRAERLNWLLARQGIPNSSIYSAEPQVLANILDHETFDAILVDAPCSGESFFAKRRESRADISDREVERCARRQTDILNVAAELLRPGGRLVYSTCTYSREENENVVERFLEEHDDFELVSTARRWPHRDGVAGGYSARLTRKGDGAATFDETKLEFGRGVLRHGPWNWKREYEAYIGDLLKGQLADLRRFEAAQDLASPERLPGLEIDEAAATAYLRGEAVPWSREFRGLASVHWRGLALGPAKAVEGRLNNQLPRTLRA